MISGIRWKRPERSYVQKRISYEPLALPSVNFSNLTVGRWYGVSICASSSTTPLPQWSENVFIEHSPIMVERRDSEARRRSTPPRFQITLAQAVVRLPELEQGADQ